MRGCLQAEMYFKEGFVCHCIGLLSSESLDWDGGGSRTHASIIIAGPSPAWLGPDGPGQA